MSRGSRSIRLPTSARDCGAARSAAAPSSFRPERVEHDVQRRPPPTKETAMQARDLMAKPTVTCHVNDPLNIAAQRMWDADVGALAVVNDDGELTGIVTDRDICMA